MKKYILIYPDLKKKHSFLLLLEFVFFSENHKTRQDQETI